jgi:hypothetical protein
MLLLQVRPLLLLLLQSTFGSFPPSSSPFNRNPTQPSEGRRAPDFLDYVYPRTYYLVLCNNAHQLRPPAAKTVLKLHRGVINSS